MGLCLALEVGSESMSLNEIAATALKRLPAWISCSESPLLLRLRRTDARNNFRRTDGGNRS